MSDAQWKPKPQKQADPFLPDRLKELIKAYDDENLEYIKNGDDYHEIEFWDAALKNPKSHRKYVNGIYRLKTNKAMVKGGVKDEAIVYSMQMTADKYDGSHIQDDRTHGFIFKPIVRHNRNAQGGQSKVQFLGQTALFTIPFSPESVDEIIAKSDVGVERFYVGYAPTRGPEITDGQYYTILNLNDFKNGTIEELMDMGAYNYSAKESRLERWRSEGAEIKRTAHNVQSVNTGTGAGTRR